jgi:cyclic-di-GMP phosphodiesterase TipF (flagellum assembly factor)
MRVPPGLIAADPVADGDTAAEIPQIPYSRLAIVAEAVAADRIDLCLDPILALEGRKARHFEVSVRLRSDDGLELSAEDVIEDIQGTGLLARLDASKLTRTADIAQRLERRGTGASLFANLSRESLSDDAFLDTFADTFIDREPLCGRLVLAFAQRDVRDFADAHWDAVSTMAELGFRFALEHVTDLDMEFEDLRAKGFEFVKLDAEVFLSGMRSADTTIPSADICRHMSDIGLGLIVGGIAHERDLARIMGFGVVFGQGTLFGAPRSVTLERSAA